MPLANKNWRNFHAYLDNDLTLQQVEEMGYCAKWYKGVFCPNRLTDKRNHDLNCTVCDGTGFLYDEGTQLKALTTSIGLKQMWQTFGRFDVGMAIISVNPENKISWFDRIEFLDSVIRYTEVLQKGTTTVDKAKYTIIEMTKLVGSSGTEYILGTDYDINDDGKIEWITGGAAPLAKAYYSVSYLCHPRYIAVELVHHFRNSKSSSGIPISQTEYPLQVIGKLDFLWGDESKKEE